MINLSSKSKGFDNVFTEITDSKKLSLNNDNDVHIFCLNMSNNKINYEGLIEYLRKNIGRYVYSRATIDRFLDNDDGDAIALNAVKLLRTVNNEKDKGAGGELGEILLNLFLEQNLHAPKLLSKMELKTTNNQYVFGSDAIHLLTLGENSYKLILGEAKIKGSYKSGIDAAFESIIESEKHSNMEISMIERNILFECFDLDTTEKIKSILIPSKRTANTNIDNAFGIFIGYTLDINNNTYGNTDFREAVKEKLKEDIINSIPYIENKINSLELSNYSFYFLPFNDAQKDRVTIMKNLKNE